MDHADYQPLPRDCELEWPNNRPLLTNLSVLQGPNAHAVQAHWASCNMSLASPITFGADADGGEIDTGGIGADTGVIDTGDILALKNGVPWRPIGLHKYT